MCIGSKLKQINSDMLLESTHMVNSKDLQKDRAVGNCAEGLKEINAGRVLRQTDFRKG
jgi:hypothetical protein